MSKNNVISVSLSKEELDLLKELLDSEYFQVSGAAKVSQVARLKQELSVLSNIKLKLEQPKQVAA